MERDPEDGSELRDFESQEAGAARRPSGWFAVACVVLVALAVAGIVIAAGTRQEPATDDGTGMAGGWPLDTTGTTAPRPQPTPETTVALPESTTTTEPIPTATGGPCSAWGLQVGEQAGLDPAFQLPRRAAVDALTACDFDALLASEGESPIPAEFKADLGMLNLADIPSFEQRGVPLTAAIVAALDTTPVCGSPDADRGRPAPVPVLCVWLGHGPDSLTETSYLMVDIVFGGVYVSILGQEECSSRAANILSRQDGPRPPDDWPVC